VEPGPWPAAQECTERRGQTTDVRRRIPPFLREALDTRSRPFASSRKRTDTRFSVAVGLSRMGRLDLAEWPAGAASRDPNGTFDSPSTRPSGTLSTNAHNEILTQEC